MESFDILAGILEGFQVTALVTLYGMMWAVPFALITGVLQHFTRGPTRFAVTCLIEFWRSSPVLILLFVLYYALPSFGIRLSSMTVGAMALGLNVGGYGSQAVRAALQALDRGQVEAGIALGHRLAHHAYRHDLSGQADCRHAIQPGGGVHRADGGLSAGVLSGHLAGPLPGAPRAYRTQGQP